VGGSTKGKATKDSMGDFQALGVWLNHHDSGVATASSTKVLTVASCKVRAMD
jgi:hypothetical protein